MRCVFAGRGRAARYELGDQATPTATEPTEPTEPTELAELAELTELTEPHRH